MTNTLLTKSNEFVYEWINNPKWWFSGSDLDLYLTNKYKDLLNIDRNDNTIPFFNRILIFDQLSRHVYRNFSFDIQNYTLKAIDIVFDILSNSLDIIHTFNDTTWCFFWLPLRHSNKPEYINLVLKFTWERLNTTNLNSIELKRFLKATYQRYPLNQINNIDLINDLTHDVKRVINNENIILDTKLWDDILYYNPGNLNNLDTKQYQIREKDYLFSHKLNLVNSQFNSVINLNLINNIQYDLIIVSRPDLNLCGSLTNVPLDKLTVPYEERKDDPNKLDIKNVEEIFDGWAIGPLHLVREYCLFYERLDYYIRKWKLGTFPLTHSNILYRYLYDLNLPILLTYHTQHLLDGNNPITDLTWGLVR